MWLIPLAAAVALGEPTGRYTRAIGGEDGLAVQTVADVVLGEDGFLWIGTSVGVMRYDGRRVEPAAPGAPPAELWRLAARPGGGVYACDRSGMLFEVAERRRTPVALPEDAPPENRSLAVDAAGGLWTNVSGAAWRRAPDGTWSAPLADQLLDGEIAIRLRKHGDDVVIVTDRGGLAHDGGAARRVLVRDRAGLEDVLPTASGAVWTISRSGVVDLFVDGAGRRVVPPTLGRGVRLFARGDEAWATLVSGVVRLSVDGPPELLGVPGGEGTFDADGALWLGSPGGLEVIPEPRTRVFARLGDQEVTWARYVDARDGVTVVSTWGGTGWRGPAGDAASPVTTISRVCIDGGGGLWGAGTEPGAPASAPQLVRWTDHDVQRRPWEHGITGCVSERDGSVWFSAGDALWRATPEGEVTRLCDAAGHLLDRDPGERVWVGSGRELCSATRAAVAAGAPEWTCADLSPTGARFANGAVEDEAGVAWVAGDDGGLIRVEGTEARRHPRSDVVFGSRAITGVRRSPRGGLWVVGAGVLHRVSVPDLRVLEVLGSWQGVPRTSAADVVEAADGTVWLATFEGLVEVAPEARVPPPGPPRTVLVEARVEGAVVSPGPITVPDSRSHVELVFAGLSFRDPARLRYRARVGDGALIDLPDGHLHLVDLHAGAHPVAVQCSLDGEHWSEPVVATITVPTPRWRHPASIAVFLALLALALAAAERARVAFLLARERERTAIAMDLHDELGSGLGSIRLLAGLLDGDDVDGDTRRDLGTRITDVAGELHAAVQELVGSLRPGGTTVGALVARLEARSRNLLPTAEFTMAVPDSLETVELSVAVRRELERIAVEAVHNAARHGRPNRVTVRISGGGARWKLTIEDDGEGFDVPESGGLGLQSMRFRAERIGASVDVQSAAGSGTTVTVHFRPHARDARRKR